MGIAARLARFTNAGVALAHDFSDSPREDLFARRAFVVALGFLALVAVLGALLRGSMIRPIPGFAYGHWLHAHSHTAFLGFVFNAFFAFALTRFVPAGERPAYRKLFVVLVVAVLGMLVTFPIQGYGPAS
ncbi:MAG: hypothetical protein MUE42_03620, partial [Opitutaceae bacterium]|nr:hypothetical protein [Opitutaceae bacterium]